jgi:type I restriction-modification system DNA methylase subunit
VLTPEHIADLFCDLVRLTPDDIVYDPCCGTGGFLIAALKRMVSSSGNDYNKIRKIKETQLIGSEVRADMFTYACSNMMMRGDGKSQIYNEDCFGSSQKNRVRKMVPTVAMLNPPYSKATGPANQLRFVLNALDDLVKNGRCAAIVQMSCALTTRKEVVSAHKELMKRHRLDAVISAPDQLFYPIGVNTCIMVFTAHVPHPKGHPTWFGYLKDDGFIIHKKKGRIPLSWEEKKRRFLSVYQHHDSPGLSVRAVVGSDDEWCAEAYLETDFSVLNRTNFEEKLRTYLGYQFTSGYLNTVSAQAASNESVGLNVSAGSHSVSMTCS